MKERFYEWLILTILVVLSPIAFHETGFINLLFEGGHGIAGHFEIASASILATSLGYIIFVTMKYIGWIYSSLYEKFGGLWIEVFSLEYNKESRIFVAVFWISFSLKREGARLKGYAYLPEIDGDKKIISNNLREVAQWESVWIDQSGINKEIMNLYFTGKHYVSVAQSSVVTQVNSATSSSIIPIHPAVVKGINHFHHYDPDSSDSGAGFFIEIGESDLESRRSDFNYYKVCRDLYKKILKDQFPYDRGAFGNIKQFAMRVVRNYTPLSNKINRVAFITSFLRIESRDADRVNYINRDKFP